MRMHRSARVLGMLDKPQNNVQDYFRPLCVVASLVSAEAAS